MRFIYLLLPIFFIGLFLFFKSEFIESSVRNPHSPTKELISGSVQNLVSDEYLINQYEIDSSFLDIVQLSYQIEECTSELLASIDFVTKDFSFIQESISSISSNEQRQASLAFILEQGIFDVQSITILNETLIYERWKENVPVLQANEFLNEIGHDSFVDAYLNLSSILERKDLVDLKKWVSENEFLVQNRFNYLERGWDSPKIISFPAFIATQLNDLSSEMREWALENVDYDSESLHYAMLSQINKEDFQSIYFSLLNSNKINEFFFEPGDGKIRNILSSVLEYGDSFDLEYILSHSKYDISDPFITPHVNNYFEELLYYKSPSEDDLKKIDLLKTSELQPVFVVNGQTGELQLQGIGKRPVLESDLNWLRSTGVDFDEAPLNSVNFDQNLVASSLRRSVDDYKRQVEQAWRKEQKCRSLLEERKNLEPQFLEISELLRPLRNQTDPWRVLSDLKPQSPVLVERYLFSLVHRTDMETKVSKAMFGALNDFNSRELNELRASLLLHEQNQVVVHACTEISVSFVAFLIESGWYADLGHSGFDKCHLENDSLFMVAHQASATEQAVPSPVYKLVKNRRYSEAYEAVSLGQNIHGIPDGRDAFGLFLDNIISFSTGPVNVEQRKLLFAFLDSTSELKDYHYKRLNRLRLKEPTLFDEIYNDYPYFNIENNLGLSRYISKV